MKITEDRITISKDEFKRVLEEGLNNDNVWETFTDFLMGELEFDIDYENVYQWLLDIVDWNINEDGTWNYSFNYDDEEFEFDTELIDDWDYDEHKRLKRLYGMIAETNNVDEIADIVEEIHCGKC